MNTDLIDICRANEERDKAQTVDGLEQITDLHNRRSNVVAASKFFSEHNAPMLIWPEDKLLLKRSDLPVIVGRPANQLNTWSLLRPVQRFMVSSDKHLREQIKVGKAYAVTARGNCFDYVTEYDIKSL